jgi:hypothetical protein
MSTSPRPHSARAGFLLVSATAFALGACSSSGGGGGGKGQSDFVPPPLTASFAYELVDENGATSVIPMRFAGEIDLAGVPFTRLQAGDFAVADPSAAEAWLDFDGGDLVVGGFAVWQPGVGEPAIPDVSVTAEEPVRVPMDVPIGEPQHRDAVGLVSLGGGATQSVEVSVDWTLVETDGTLETPLGVQHGLLHSTVSASVLGTAVTGEIWGRSGVGFVAGYVESSLLPGRKSAGLLGYLANEAAGNGYWLTRADAVLSPASPGFVLDTFDVAQTWDADKDTHAKMLLELRWVDVARALTDEAPPAFVEAGTVWGSFSTATEASPVSLLHPEENDAGYVHWLTVVDQAAKNEPENGISYHIGASYSGVEGEVRVSASILYKRLDTGGDGTEPL